MLLHVCFSSVLIAVECHSIAACIHWCTLSMFIIVLHSFHPNVGFVAVDGLHNGPCSAKGSLHAQVGCGCGDCNGCWNIMTMMMYCLEEKLLSLSHRQDRLDHDDIWSVMCGTVIIMLCCCNHHSHRTCNDLGMILLRNLQRSEIGHLFF